MKMVNNISSISRSVGMDDLFRVFFEVIQRSCHSIYATWQEKEFSLLKSNANKELASIILEKVKGDSTIAHSITRSGKKDMYSELLWYLTFGSLRWPVKHGDPKEVICHEVKRVPVMGLVCGSRLRRWKSVNTKKISMNFVESML